MDKFLTAKTFRDREGKEFSKLSAKQKAALKVYPKNSHYESDNKEWTDYLVKEGYLSPVEDNKPSASSTQSAPKKRAPRKKRVSKNEST